MKNRMVATITLITMMTTCALGFAADTYIYAPPYEVVTDSHATINMPQDFSIESCSAYTLIASDDFNDNIDGSATLSNAGRENMSFENGRVKLTGNPDKKAYYVMTYSGDIACGGYYAFSCKISTSGIIREMAVPENGLQAMRGTDIIADCVTYYGRYSEVSEDCEYTMTQILKVPEGADALRLVARYNEASGTAYFDDFKLYHIALDPMEAILLKPNYKGLIYGDGKADISLNVAIDECAGFFLYEDMSLSVKLTDGEGNIYNTAEADNVGSLMNFVFSSEGLENGDYYIECVLYSGEKVISKKEVTIRKRPKSYRPKTYVDDDGFLVRDGVRTIGKRIYCTDGKSVGAAQAAKDAQITSLANYGYWWAKTDKTEINAIKQTGMMSHINFKGFHYNLQKGTAAPSMVKAKSDIAPFLYKVTSDYKGSSVLDGYNLFDEANPLISGSEIAWANEILAEADIDHPTYGVANRYWDDYGVYTKMADVLSVDPYPVTGKEGDDLGAVGKAVRAAKENFPNRPVGITLQGFFYSKRGDTRGPNLTELLNMMWQALCEGATVVEWYSYDTMSTDTNKTYDEWNNDLKAVFSELSEYENILLSAEPSPKFSVVGGGEWLNISTRRYNGKTYLFAVNNTNTKKSATVKIDGGESVSLSLEPLEVKKLELTQNEYLSPKAELKAMGFSNGDDVFAVAEGEENTLYVHPDSTVINYCADISDGAKLYIGKKEMPTSGKITVRVAKEFTVTVAAADGVTKTSKKYNVVK